MCHVVPDLELTGGYQGQALALARYQRAQPDLAPAILTHAGDRKARVETHRADPGPVHRLEAGLRRYDPTSWWSRHGHGFDVVHCHALHRLSARVVELAARSGVPSVVKVATSGDVTLFRDPSSWRSLAEVVPRAPRRALWRAALRSSFRRLRLATRFVALNEGIAGELDAAGLAWVHVPNGVDVERFRPAGDVERAAARAALGLGPNEVCVAAVSRLVERKDLGTLIDAVGACARGESPPLRLLVAGEGPLRQALEERARQQGIAARTTWLGNVPDVRPLLRATDLFVSPSRREGLPNALLEAWASGLCTIASDVPGHRVGATETVTLYPAGEAAALAAALTRLATSPLRRRTQAAAARKLAEARFSLERVAEAYRALYAELPPEGSSLPSSSDHSSRLRATNRS